MTIFFGGCIKVREKEYWMRIKLSLMPECRSYKISLQTNSIWFHQNVILTRYLSKPITSGFTRMSFLQDLSPSQWHLVSPECRSHKISLQANYIWFHQNVVLTRPLSKPITSGFTKMSFLQDLSPSQWYLVSPECRSHKISFQTNNIWFHQNVVLTRSLS